MSHKWLHTQTVRYEMNAYWMPHSFFDQMCLYLVCTILRGFLHEILFWLPAYQQ